MNYILMAAFIGSTASGPTMPVVVTAEFSDEPACQRAGGFVDNLSKRIRVLGSQVQFVCIPKSSEPPKTETLSPSK